MPDGTFQGQHVLITGGTRGIGRATALKLAGEGATVSLNFCARAEDADETLHSIRNSGGDACVIKGDVSKPETAAKIAAAAREAFGPIDHLVHSAGVSVIEPADDVTWETWKRTMDVNLDGTFNMIYAVKDEMLERQFGRIVTVSSIAGLRARKNQVHYSTSKAAVIALTRCCAEAWAGKNIRVNCVCPGLTETEMAYTLSPEARDTLIENTPMRRIGKPEELAAVVRFLLTDESSFMTGQTIVASGGRVMLPG